METHDTTTRRVALVSGGNRGIGLEICRQLAKHGLHVVLGSRDAAQGKAAADELCAEGLSVESQVLDVTAQDTIDALAAYIKSTFGGLDVLVNNAGIAMKGFDAEVARKTIDVNFSAPAPASSWSRAAWPTSRACLITSALAIWIPRSIARRSRA